MKNLIIKSVVGFAYNHLAVSKATNEWLKGCLQTAIALLIFLLLAVDWDATLDNWGWLK